MYSCLSSSAAELSDDGRAVFSYFIHPCRAWLGAKAVVAGIALIAATFPPLAVSTSRDDPATHESLASAGEGKEKGEGGEGKGEGSGWTAKQNQVSAVLW